MQSGLRLEPFWRRITGFYCKYMKKHFTELYNSTSWRGQGERLRLCPAAWENASAVCVTHKVCCQWVYAQNEVVESKNFDDCDNDDVAWVERVDSFEFHADFELMRTWSGARRVLEHEQISVVNYIITNISYYNIIITPASIHSSSSWYKKNLYNKT